MKKFNVAAIQMKCKKGDIGRNIDRAFRFIWKAHKKNAKMICLPELFDTGYNLATARDISKKSAPKTKKILSSIAGDLKVYLLAAIANYRGSSLYNTCFVFSPEGRIIGKYDKNFLFDGGLEKESRFFTAGKGSSPVKTKYGNIGALICNDLRYPMLFSGLATRDVKLIFISSAWSLKRIAHWKTLLKARAIENQIYIIAANHTGGSGNLSFGGFTSIVDFNGDVVSVKNRAEGIVSAEIDYKKLFQKRTSLPTYEALKEML